MNTLLYLASLFCIYLHINVKITSNQIVGKYYKFLMTCRMLFGKAQLFFVTKLKLSYVLNAKLFFCHGNDTELAEPMSLSGLDHMTLVISNSV